MPQYFITRLVRQVQVKKDTVRVKLFRKRQPALTILGFVHLEMKRTLPQEPAIYDPVVRRVIDDQDCSHVIPILGVDQRELERYRVNPYWVYRNHAGLAVKQSVDEDWPRRKNHLEVLPKG